MDPVLALAISTVVAGIGWRLRALSGDGAIAAIAIGIAILSFTGWPGLVVLGAFFATSTFVSRVTAAADPTSDQARTETRDRWQVLANGGFAALGAAAEPVVSGLGIWLVSIVLAAAASDTWSTAFGRLSARPPRDLLTRRPVAPGTSGGVTWFGTIGGLMGATAIGLVAASATGESSLYFAAAVIGVAGMVVDSGLGSAAQARFHCQHCDQPTERRVHHCGTETRWLRGWRWLDNDGVNGLATGFAFGTGLVAWWL